MTLPVLSLKSEPCLFEKIEGAVLSVHKLSLLLIEIDDAQYVYLVHNGTSKNKL